MLSVALTVAIVGLVVTLTGRRWPGRLVGLSVMAAGAVTALAAAAPPTAGRWWAVGSVGATLGGMLLAAGLLARTADQDGTPADLDEHRG